LFTFRSQTTAPAALSPSTAQAEPPAPAGAAARGLIERQLWVLGRLAEAGLNVALAIERQAMAAADAEDPEAAPAGRVVEGDIALAYSRAARAVRLTVALQAKLVKDLQALDEGLARKRRGDQVNASRALEASQAARKARVERIVERVIQAETFDEGEVDRLTEAAYERLDHDEIYGDLLARPVSEILALICRDLGLSPDWSRLAEEAWAQEEIESGVAGSPWTTLKWVDPPAPPAAVEPAPTEPQAASP
jgi:hypothetical protein